MEQSVSSASKSPFCFKRFLALARYDKEIYLKATLLLSLLTITAEMTPEFLTLLFSDTFAYSVEGNAVPPLKIILSSLIFIVFIFRSIHGKINKQWTPLYLQIPATPLEKYILILIEMVLLSFWSVAIAHIGFFLSLLVFAPEKVFDWFYWIPKTVTIETNIDPFPTFSATLLFVALMTIGLFCAITYKKYATSIFLTMAYWFLFIVALVYSLAKLTFLRGLDINEIFYARIIGMVSLVTSVLFLIGSYYNLKRKSFR